MFHFMTLKWQFSHKEYLLCVVITHNITYERQEYDIEKKVSQILSLINQSYISCSYYMSNEVGRRYVPHSNLESQANKLVIIL